MLDKGARRSVLACCAVSVLVTVGGCGGSSPDPTGDAEPALRPSGASALLVRYHCLAGRRDAISVSLPDPRRLAEVLNPIQVCELDGGLADVAVALRCSRGAPEKDVRITAVDGRLLPSAVQAACG